VKQPTRMPQPAACQVLQTPVLAGTVTPLGQQAALLGGRRIVMVRRCCLPAATPPLPLPPPFIVEGERTT
jgi:hypothetical protein